MECQLPRDCADDEQIRDLLARARTIAVVGASDRPERDSYVIVEFLKEAGYIVLPVNPNYGRVAGLTCYADLSQIDEAIDVVDVFRRPDAVGPIADEAIRLKAGALWLQEGVVNNEAAARASAAGLTVVQNRCIYKEHVAHFG